MSEKLSLQEWVPRFVEALREAEAAGVKQTTGQLGRRDGCRCAEGVIADLLVAEGLMERKDSELVDTVQYRAVGHPLHSWTETILPRAGFFGATAQLSGAGRDGEVCPVWELNDVEKMTFGEIADAMETLFNEGWYAGE